MTSSSSFYESEFLSYAFYGIAAKADEDRFNASMNHSSCGINSMATFGVFDGHMGVRTTYKFDKTQMIK